MEVVQLVFNCHLHFDHCGGNAQLAGRTVFVQCAEVAAARTSDYTLPELVEAPHLRYVELVGEAEVLAGVTVVPTPGHPPGHQSLVVRRVDGTIIVAGQSHDTATAYRADVLAWRALRAAHPPPLVVTPAWIDRLQRLDPASVVFAHVHAVAALTADHSQPDLSGSYPMRHGGRWPPVNAACGTTKIDWRCSGSTPPAWLADGPRRQSCRCTYCRWTVRHRDPWCRESIGTRDRS